MKLKMMKKRKQKMNNENNTKEVEETKVNNTPAIPVETEEEAVDMDELIRQEKEMEGVEEPTV
jgi:protein-disulfide isomerase